MSKEFDHIFNQGMSYKHKYEYWKDNDLVKFMFYFEFNNEGWTKIILSRIHDGKFWLGYNMIDISTNLIHEVTRL